MRTDGVISEGTPGWRGAEVHQGAVHLEPFSPFPAPRLGLHPCVNYPRAGRKGQSG